MATKERLETYKRTKLGLTLLTLISLLTSDQAPRDQQQINRDIARSLSTTIQLGVEETRKFVGNAKEGATVTLKKSLVELDKYIDTTYLVFKETERLDFESAAKIYRFVATKDNQLPKIDTVPTSEQLLMKEYEIYVRSIALGFASKDTEFFPVTWEFYDWEKHLFAYAETNCKENTTSANQAYDPRVPGIQYPSGREYLLPGTMVTLAHEAVHRGGDICRIYLVGSGSVFQYTGLVDNGVERTAQIGALEIITSMANDGDPMAVHASFHLKREMSRGSLIYLGLKDPSRLGELIALMKEMGEDPFTISKVERMFSDAQQYPFLRAQYLLGLEQYAYSPMQVIIESAKHPKHETKKLLKMGSGGLLRFESYTLDNIHLFLRNSDKYIEYLKTQAK
jgi:hypothetical protein